MKPMIKPLRGDCIMNSPVFAKQDYENPMEEIGEHVGLEMLGLGGLGMVLGILKIKTSLNAANSPAGGMAAIRPRAALNPSKSFKPGA